jgi:hypothetical protein
MIRFLQEYIRDKINGETERDGVWFPEDGDSCSKNWADI